MFISAKKKIVLLAICLALSGACVLPSAAYADDTIASLKKQLEAGEAAEALLAARRDAELKTISKSGLSQKQIEIKAEAVLETYRVESSKLVAKYRQPLMEHLQQKFPDVQDSVGTPLYARDELGKIRTDPQGRKIIHPDFRGWSGDHDMQGSAADVERVRKYLNENGFDTTGFGSRDLGDLTPGDLSNKRLELTINLDPTDQSIKKQLQNPELTPEARRQLEAELARAKKSDSMLKAGDSAHQTVANVAAQGKETYVGVSMRHDQPGVKAVLVNDHYKKAAEGLGLSGESLLAAENRDAFQGMVKGTEKAVRDSRLDADAIDATLKKHRMDMSAAEYRALAAKLKVAPYPEIYGLDAAKMENLRKVNQDLIDQSVSKTMKEAATEIDSHRRKVAELSERIKQTSDPAEKQALTAQRERLGNEIIDTRVKLQATLAANDARRQKYGLPQREKIAEADALKLTPETAPSSKHAALKARSDLKQAASKAVDRAGTALGLYGYYSAAIERAEEVVAESSPSDSDAMLIVEATKRGTMDAIGLTDAVDIMGGEMDLLSSAMQNMDKGNYFTAFYEWNTAMVKGMGKLGWKMFNDSIVTPVKDTAVAVYEGGTTAYETVRDEATIARNESEQAAQQDYIAQKKAEQEAIGRPAVETLLDINDPALLSIDSAAQTEHAPVQAEAMQHDRQIDPRSVSGERMLVTEEDDNAIAPDSLQSGLDAVKNEKTKELTQEEVYRLVPKDTMMAYSERVALAQKMLADEATGGAAMQIDPNAVAEDRMILSPASDTPAERMILTPEPQPKRSTVHTEPMIDGDVMEETIVPYDGGYHKTEENQQEVNPIWQSLSSHGAANGDSASSAKHIHLGTSYGAQNLRGEGIDWWCEKFKKWPWLDSPPEGQPYRVLLCGLQPGGSADVLGNMYDTPRDHYAEAVTVCGLTLYYAYENNIGPNKGHIQKLERVNELIKERGNKPGFLIVQQYGGSVYEVRRCSAH